VGVIVKIERDSFKVLDNTGNVQTILLQEMGHKRNTKHATALDCNQNTIAIGDVVRVIDGPHKVHISKPVNLT
jgi:transcription elongation factor SPT5